MKSYHVAYDTKRNKREYPHEMIVEAKNLKDAREQFELRYFNSRTVGNPAHPFHIRIRLIRKEEIV